jgi:hypothetical protein
MAGGLDLNFILFSDAFTVSQSTWAWASYLSQTLGER